MLRSQQINNERHTEDTFKALVDAIIPQTPELAEIYEEVQYYGALDLRIDEFMIWELNHFRLLTINDEPFNIPLAVPTAVMLDVAAEVLIDRQENRSLLNFTHYPGGGPFSALSPSDRFRAINLLEELTIDLNELPLPFRNNPGFIALILGAIHRFPMMGYYSEWYGYGTTRLNMPDDRVLEYPPVSWEQVGYPGPARGYLLLSGFLIDEFTE
jgi:hypothetical protein